MAKVKKAAPKKKPAAPKKVATAKKKPAPKKKVAPRKPPALAKGARGLPLVEAAIAAETAAGGKHRPVKPNALAKLSMPDGTPIPVSLAAALAHHDLGLVEKGALKWRTFPAMIDAEFGAGASLMFKGWDKLLSGQCLAMPEGSDSRRFLYAGVPDEHGEYPVLIVDTDDLPWVGVAYPGFDAYFADGTVAKINEHSYIDGWKKPAWKPALEAAARRNFGGLWQFDYQEPAHLDGDDAAREAMAGLDAALTPEEQAQLTAGADFDPEDFA